MAPGGGSLDGRGLAGPLDRAGEVARRPGSPVPDPRRIQDALPLEIPLSFFLTAPLALAAAGVLALVGGAGVFANRWAPGTLAMAHLGTLGFVSMVMMGATYQVLPGVVGSAAPWARSAHVVHALFTLGVAAFCWGIARESPSLVFVAITALTFGILLFLVPVGVALARAPAVDATVFGIRAAVGFFFVAALVGIWMAHGFSGMRFPGSRLLWSQAHLSVALVGWVGGLLAAISWRVLPGFYGAAPTPGGWRWTVQILAFVGALGPAIVLGADYLGLLAGSGPAPVSLAAGLAVPGILAVWGLHPALAARSLSGRRRRENDGSLRFWQAGLSAAPLTALSAVAAWSLEAPRWDVLFGWLALMGWVGMIMHGMLTRIVPFLVWLHRFAPRQDGTDDATAPAVEDLRPEGLTRRGFALHLGSMLLGAAAIVILSDPLARLAGLSMILTAISIGHLIVRVLGHRPR